MELESVEGKPYLLIFNYLSRKLSVTDPNRKRGYLALPNGTSFLPSNKPSQWKMLQLCHREACHHLAIYFPPMNFHCSQLMTSFSCPALLNVKTFLVLQPSGIFSVSQKRCCPIYELFNKDN